MGRHRAYVKTKRSFFPEDPVIPSQVTDVITIHYNPRIRHYDPGDNYFEDKDDWLSEDGHLLTYTEYNAMLEKEYIDLDVEKIVGGKWMLFHDASEIDIARGMTEHDYAWQFMFPIADNYKNTRVKSVCCSTGFLGYCTRLPNPNSKKGVICCFTEDYRDIRDVKKAGDSIRKMFNYPLDMHYKTDAATISGKFACYGHKYICIYKHKPDCSMYVRDTIDPLRWRPVEIAN